MRFVPETTNAKGYNFDLACIDLLALGAVLVSRSPRLHGLLSELAALHTLSSDSEDPILVQKTAARSSAARSHRCSTLKEHPSPRARDEQGRARKLRPQRRRSPRRGAVLAAGRPAAPLKPPRRPVRGAEPSLPLPMRRSCRHRLPRGAAARDLRRHHRNL